MTENILYIRKQLKKKLDPERYEHTLGVAYTAMCLAMKYGADLYKAEVAGLLHDCAKYYPDTIKLEKCRKYNISVSETEAANPSLLHAKLGAYLAMDKYKIRDMEIVNAILYHTTGRPAMSVLEKIIFVADYIEPRRDKAPDLPETRRLAFEDLDTAVFTIMDHTLSYLVKKGLPIDDTTQKACDFYRMQISENPDKEPAQQAESDRNRLTF